MATTPKLSPMENVPKGRVKAPKGSQAPRLVILGRGQLGDRTPTLIRLRPQTLKRMKLLTDGPNYLIIQIALEKLFDELEKTDEMQLVRAEDLG